MRCILLLLCFLLSSCSAVSTTEKIADSTIKNITAIEHSLPSECRTSAVSESFAALKTQVTTIVEACDIEKESLKQKIRLRNAIIATLLIVIIRLLMIVFK